MQRADLGFGGWIIYEPGFLSAERVTELWEAVLPAVAWEQRSVRAGAREIPQPRLMGWAGELPYRYAGLTLEPRPWPAPLAALRDHLGSLLGAEFNHAVLNRYRDGGDHMGWHADDERELGQNPLIAALSLGAVRPFQLSPKRKRRTVRTLNLASGSLLVMGGALQHTWYHGVPVDRATAGERINLTFRRLLGAPGEVPDWRPPRPREPAPS